MTARAGKTQKTTDRPPPTLRSPTIVDTGGVASVHLTLAVCDYEHVREIARLRQLERIRHTYEAERDEGDEGS